MHEKLTAQESESVASYRSAGFTVALLSVGPRQTDMLQAIEASGGRILRRNWDDAGNDRVFRLADIVVVTACDRAEISYVEVGDIASEVRVSGKPVIFDGTIGAVDIAFNAFDMPNAQILVAASNVDRVAALATACAQSSVPALLYDVQSDETQRLNRLADEVGRIARSLADLARSEPAAASGVDDNMIGYAAHPRHPIVTARESRSSEVRKIMRLRRLRDRYFPKELFADPAWDMLLDLTAARAENVKVAVSSLCIAAAVPPTTALRYIKRMTDEGLFVRTLDPFDARRVFINLSDNTATAMTNFLTASRTQDGFAI